jgi:hypothetical protein
VTVEDLEEILPKNKRLFLMASNIVVVGTIVLDIMFIMNIISLPLDSFTLYNLIILGVSLYAYRIKKKTNEELARRRKASSDAVTT